MRSRTDSVLETDDAPNTIGNHETRKGNFTMQDALTVEAGENVECVCAYPDGSKSLNEELE